MTIRTDPEPLVDALDESGPRTSFVAIPLAPVLHLTGALVVGALMWVGIFVAFPHLRDLVAAVLNTL